MIQLRECNTAADVMSLAAETARRIQEQRRLSLEEQRRQQRREAAKKSEEHLQDELIAIALRAPAPLTDPVKAWQGKIRDIQSIVARFYGITIGDLIGPRRTVNLCRPRQTAMYLCSTILHRSLPEIGRRFGGRDHTTALHAIRTVTVKIERDPELKDQIAQLERIIRG